MNRNVLIVAVLLILLVGAGVILSRNKGGQTTATASISPTTEATVTPSTSSSASNDVTAVPNVATVTIANQAFSPKTLTVKKGTTVTWTNQDSISHTVTSTVSGKGPDSGLLGNGQSYSFTFTDAGTYNYVCTIHPNMQATVIVTD